MSTFAADAPSVERHPPGLFLLFFVEMWERFSFYGMRALLVFYLIKGFMKASDDQAYAIYGAYGALVYATPYLGGMLADRLLGARLAVIWGAILMAAGHLLMTIETEWALFGALALLICGNGFFKPNISTMVGALYSRTSPKRDAGFTIFYMGINLGAALAPLICGYIGETYGWHYGFGLATLGMLAGLVTFISWSWLARWLILLASLGLIGIMFFATSNNTLQLIVSLPIAAALLGAGIVSFVQLGKGSIPKAVGAPPHGARIGLSRFLMVFVGTLITVPIFALLVARNEYAVWVLNLAGVLAFGSIIVWTINSPRIERDRLIVILVLCFFSMLFWAFFEQAGSSVNNFTDRNVDRVVGDDTVVAGTVYENVPITQEFLGVEVNGRVWKLPDIEAAIEARSRAALGTPLGADAQAAAEVPPADGATDAALADGSDTDAAAPAEEVEVVEVDLVSVEVARGGAEPGFITFTATDAHEGAALGAGGNELRASIFQAANPIFILIFGLPFSLLWGWLGVRGKDPSAPVKFALGLFQLGLGFLAFWYGAMEADSNGMVALGWLLLGYLLQTTGELCLSPVGLSLVTRLSPTRIVSTIMGAWFLATAFSHLLAAAIAKLTGVSEGGGGSVIPPPIETVGVYGGVFGGIGIAALVSAVVMFAISGVLTRMMHVEQLGEESPHH